MTKEQLFQKYHIKDSHNIWVPEIDNWMSVEIYRLMHEGNLPPTGEMSTDWITGFLDKMENDDFMTEIRKHKNWGNLYLTAKRMVCTMHERILEQYGK